MTKPREMWMRRKLRHKRRARLYVYSLIILSFIIWGLFLIDLQIPLGHYDYNVDIDYDHYMLRITIINVTFIDRDYPNLRKGDNVSLGFVVEGNTFWIANVTFIPGALLTINKTTSVYLKSAPNIRNIRFIDSFLKSPIPFTGLKIINKTLNIIELAFWYGSLCTRVISLIQLIYVGPSIHIINNGNIDLKFDLYVIPYNEDHLKRIYNTIHVSKIIRKGDSQNITLEFDKIVYLNYDVSTYNSFPQLVLTNHSIFFSFRRNLFIAVIIQILLLILFLAWYRKTSSHS